MGNYLTASRCKLLVAHLPETLRRLSLDVVQIEPCDLILLIRHLPLGLRELALVDMDLDDDVAAELARSFPPALRSLQLLASVFTYTGLTTVLAAAPVHQIESLDLSVNLEGPEMMVALAEWLARSTRLEYLALDGLDGDETDADDLAAISVILNALPPTLRSLHLASTLRTLDALAAAIPRTPLLQKLDIAHTPDVRSGMSALLPVLPATLQYLMLGFIDLNRSDILAGLAAAQERGVQWPDLDVFNMCYTELTLPRLDEILAALKHLVDVPTRQRRRTRIFVAGNQKL
ncbi:hypothetical protein GGF31_003246, partial [Allomyces arbusculus]